LRTLWYSFIKKTLLGIVRKLKKPENTFYNTLSELIKSSKGKLKYKDFNIENSGIVYRIAKDKGLGKNPILAVEKESLFSVFENMSKLLGIHIYASGGQASLSGTEYFYDKLPVKDVVELFTLTDFDPSGLDIDNTFKEQFGLYGNKVKRKRVGVHPEYYTPEELERSLYKVKKSDKERWNKRPIRLIRKKYNIPKEKGLEIESLPANPLPILDKLFKDVELDSWKGQARMRLIVLKHLIDYFGLSGFFANYLRENFDMDSKVDIIIDKKTGIRKLSDLAYEASEEIDRLVKDITESLEPEKEDVRKELDKFLKGLIKEKTADKEELEKFKKTVVKAVANDSDHLPFKYIPAPDLDISVDKEKKSTIERSIEKLQTILDILRDKDYIQIFKENYELCKMKEKFKSDYFDAMK